MKSKENPKVDFYFQKEKKWQEEITKMRAIALSCGLTEELKWGCPCYTFNGQNVVLIHVFKEYCAYLLFKGALLNDEHAILVHQSKNVQAARQIRFTNVSEVSSQQKILKEYLLYAIEIEKSGLKVALKKTEEYDVPVEFDDKLNAMPALKKAFEKLTPGRRRGYLLFFSAPKQSKTREARIEKSIPQILQGKGLND